MDRIKPRGKLFRDPVHRLIRIQPGDDFILDLIDTPVFQRLRRIRQLGVSWMTYPGAEHSRFSHSLGVFNFAQRILGALKERYTGVDDPLVEYLAEHEKELKAAALLHDLGHTPFSHMLERAFDHSINHEEKTKQLICDQTGPVARVLRNAGLDPAHIAEITQGSKGTSVHRLLVDIVSSQLDADRMDYLLRDSLYTGVEYGTYDAEWLIRNLCVGRDPHPRPGATGGDYEHLRLCLDRARGVHTAEQLIIARLHMTLQVYMHRMTRGFEVLLLNLFRSAAQLAKQSNLPDGTPSVVKAYFRKDGDLSIDEWLQFDEMAMFTAIAAWAGNDEHDYRRLRYMALAFRNRKRIIRSREIRDATPVQLMALDRELTAISESGLDWDIDDGGVMPYKGLRYEATKASANNEEQSAESILLASGEVNEPAVAIDTVSEILRTLDFASQSVFRIYYSRTRAAGIERVLQEHGVTAH